MYLLSTTLIHYLNIPLLITGYESIDQNAYKLK